MVAVLQVAAATTFPLRQQVLRPHESVSELALPGDDDPDAGHFAAVDEDGTVVGTATVRPEVPGWRLRGMATAPGRRSQGIGGAVLAAVIVHVADHGGGVLWCHARVPAVAFYRRNGFVTSGEPWNDSVIGPHVLMTRSVAARRLDPG